MHDIVTTYAGHHTHNKYLSKVGYLNKEAWVATTNEENGLSVYDLVNGQLIQKVGIEAMTTTMAIDSTGTKVAAGFVNGTILGWNLN